MKIQQYVITDRVKLTLLPHTYTFEIDGKIHEADDEDSYDDRDVMIENALEQIALEFDSCCTDDTEFEGFEVSMRKLHNQLLPEYPVEI